MDAVMRQPKWSDKPLYYYCDWVTYRKLKAIKRWYYRALTEAATCKRWARRTVNKSEWTGPAIAYCSGIVDVEVRKNGLAWVKKNYEIEKLATDTFWLARMPHEELGHGFDDSLIRKIDTVYRELGEWHEEERGEKLISFEDN